MKYADGQEVRLGDRVKLGEDEGGIVEQFVEVSDGFPTNGAMIRFPMFGEILYEKPQEEEDLQLIKRAASC